MAGLNSNISISAEPELTELPELPTSSKKEELSAPKMENETSGANGVESIPFPKAKEEELSPSNSLGFNIRIDTAYSGGGAVYQGFSIPSIRLSGFGEVDKYLNYRLSFGQTREFSTASLAQILPVEAFVVLSLNPNSTETYSNLKLKVGLFSPSFNPVWTPDLSYLNIPDFNETHRALFLSREVGAELMFEPFNKVLEMGVGAFNGTGVFAQNTNNAKAFTAYLKLNIQMQKWNFSLGTGNYFLNQASLGSINYKSTRVSDVFLNIEIPHWNTQFVIDGFTAQFDDSVSGIAPLGGAAVLSLGITSWLGLFGRYEYATKSPVLSGCIRQFQIGPEIYFNPSVKSFITFTELEAGGSKEKTLMVRLRLSI